MKILLEYNPGSGQLTAADGMIVGTYLGINGFVIEQPADKPDSPASIHALISLKDAGYTADEIVQLKNIGLV